MSSRNSHFTALVVGKDHKEIMATYDINKKEKEPYVVYEYSKKEEYQKNKIASYEKIISQWPAGEQEEELQYLKECVADWKQMDAVDFYLELTDGYELDEETGNAISYENPNGKFFACHVGKNFSLPFILKDGSESYSARKSDIDWGKIHLYNVRPYEVAWETVVEHRKPADEEEKRIYDNMKERMAYFLSFGTKEYYVASCSAFWAYAFVTKDKWKEYDNSMPQFDWVTGFYERFVKPLPEDAWLTIYECVKD